jgi:hypothetical protein
MIKFNYIKYLPIIIIIYLIISTLSNFITESIFPINYPGFENPSKIFYYLIFLTILQSIFFNDSFLKIIYKFYDFEIKSIFCVIFFIIITNEFFIQVRFNRSFIFSIIVSPFLFYYFPIFFKKIRISIFEKKIKNFFYLIILSMTIIPGFYMPPFYDGIPGWVYKTSSSVESFSYFAIKNKKGDHILLSNAFFNPGNFPHRAQGYYEVTKKDKELKLLYEYLIELYCNQWEYTKKGFYETQKYLGNFAFPGHNSYLFLENYKNFEPKNIISIGQLSTIYEVESLKIIERTYKEKLIIKDQCQ